MNLLKTLKSTSAEKIKSMMKGYVIKVSIIIVLVVVFIGVIFKAIDYTSSRYACHVQWVESGIDYKYTLRGGCLLNRNGGWIPAENFRVE